MDPWASIDKAWWPLVRRCGQSLAKYFEKLGITPNQLTVGRTVLLAPLVLIGYAWPSYWGPVFGLAALLVYSLLDFTDGALAIRTGRITLVGRWLDNFYDCLLQCVLITGGMLHVVFVGHNPVWVVVAAACLLSQMALGKHSDMYRGLFDHRQDFMREIGALETLPLFRRLSIDIIMVASSASILLFTYRYAVIVFTLLGRVEWLMLMIAVTQTIRWLVMHVVMARLLSENIQDGDAMIQLMRRYVLEGYSVAKV